MVSARCVVSGMVRGCYLAECVEGKESSGATLRYCGSQCVRCGLPLAARFSPLESAVCGHWGMHPCVPAAISQLCPLAVTRKRTSREKTRLPRVPARINSARGLVWNVMRCAFAAICKRYAEPTAAPARGSIQTPKKTERLSCLCKGFLAQAVAHAAAHR
jgi:hypothetical protein